ncbi:hypothetical protein ABBQ32_000625 [Trebouxia sp. C0010 RCD-2024]
MWLTQPTKLRSRDRFYMMAPLLILQSWDFCQKEVLGARDGPPTTKDVQDLHDEMRLLRSDFAARYTEAKSIAFSLVSGAAANQLLEDLHLTEADGFEETPFETPV